MKSRMELENIDATVQQQIAATDLLKAEAENV